MGSKNSKGEVNKLSCAWKKVNEGLKKIIFLQLFEIFFFF